MKKLIIISCLSMMLYGVAQAQNDGGNSGRKSSNTTSDMSSDAANAASDMCDCINATIGDLHPQLMVFLEDMVDLGQEQAEQKFAGYIMGVGEEEQARILRDAQKLEQIGEGLENSDCGSELESKYSQYEDNVEFEEKVMNHLQNKANCKLTYLFLMAGMQEE